MRAQREMLLRHAAERGTAAQADLWRVVAAHPGLRVAHELQERVRRIYEEANNPLRAAQRLGKCLKAARRRGLAAFAQAADFVDR